MIPFLYRLAEMSGRHAEHRTETTTEIADGWEACGKGHLRDAQLTLTQQFGGTTQTDGADELRGLLTCGGLYLAVEGHATHAEVARQHLHTVALVAEMGLHLWDGLL